MKPETSKRQIVETAVLLVLVSVLLYTLHYAVFRDMHHIFLYLVGDMAFLPIQVLLVTLILERVLAQRERRAMLTKLNMVIGAFFAEAGTPLLAVLRCFDREAQSLYTRLRVTGKWSAEDFREARSALANRPDTMEVHGGDLEALRDLMVGRREFLVRLLENPNLLEHERFTELLWAVFHLADELSHRPSVRDLPVSDYTHLAVDMRRAYDLLIREWLHYIEHLKSDYPYLFSLAIRTSPFDPQASVVVQ